MKRFIVSLLLLATGAALGGGGLYLGLNWTKYNPFRDRTEIASKTVLGKLRQACASENALKGAYVKSAESAEGKLVLRGFAANKKQVEALDSTSRTLLHENPDLQAQCEQGVSTAGVKIVALVDQLPVWQREFEECKGAEKDSPENVVKREVMRTTRLDGIAFNEDGKLIVSGVCVKGDKKTDATGAVILGLLKSRLEAAGVTPELMPEFAIAIHYFPNPAVTLQNKLAKIEQARDVRMLSAWYDGKGKLHLEAIVGHEDQRKFIDEAIDGLLKNPQSLAMVSTPAAQEAVPDFVLRAIIFEGEASARELQKKLIEHARKEGKAYLRHARLANIVPTVIVDEKKETSTDDEGNPGYYFRVTGQLLEGTRERKQVESELAEWLEESLPRLSNPNQTPVLPKLDFSIRPSPVAALQERVVRRGLDGAVFTDAYFDGEGKLEITGRLHQPGEAGKAALQSAIKDLLDDDAPWILALKPHEANKDGQPIAWTAALRECQAKLAADRAVGQRVRIDRLFFNLVNGQPQLVGDGVFLSEGTSESPNAAITTSLDAVIVSRGKADVATSSFKSVKNPLADLQNLLGQRPDLDGALLTQARFDADGGLVFDGYLGGKEQKTALAPLIIGRLSTIPELLKKDSDPETGLSSSIDAMKLHASPKGEWKWSDILRAYQGEVAAAAEPTLHRTCVERAYFQYAEPQLGGKMTPSRQLVLRVHAISLAKPAEKIDAAVLTKTLGMASKRLLPSVAIQQEEVELHTAPTPIVELQKWAVSQRLDGVFFKDAYYDSAGKLVFSGLRGDADHLKLVKARIEEITASKDMKSIAPWGVADLEKMRLSPWGVTLEEIRDSFAGDAQTLLKQTRIDRAYFEHDAASQKARVRFEGISIYQGKTPMPEQALAEVLRKQLKSRGVDGFELSVDGIERKANPMLELQKKAIDAGIDGVVFSQIGFDAKGACYVKLPLVPAGQEANIRKLLDETAKTHPHLGVIQLR